MTLPSTIACGNIVRPTLNFNWYAVPDSSRGNYHSVHNKSHNNHLENDFIICCASIKVSSGKMHMVGRNGDEMRSIDIFGEDVRLIGRCWMHLFPATVIKISCLSSKWMAQKNQKWIGPHNGIPSEQGHATMGHFRLPVLSLSIPVTSSSFNNGARRFSPTHALRLLSSLLLYLRMTS